MQTLLDQSQKKNEKVALQILDQPTVTVSGKGTIRGNMSAYSQRSGLPSPVRDYSLCESNSPICLNNVEDGDEYLNHI